jgi:hypothetical protein
MMEQIYTLEGLPGDTGDMSEKILGLNIREILK